jgi:hypothetical protein
MKTVKSALLGNRQLIDNNKSALDFQLKQILKEHRAIIINRLLSDLPTYLDYKFQLTKPTRKQLDELKEKLLNLKHDNLMFAPYEPIFKQLETKAVVHLTNEPFYVEIDECVSRIISHSQLKFV